MAFHVIIPARFAASRLPGKPLLMIGDKPVSSGFGNARWRAARNPCGVARIDVRCQCQMTSAHHASGTDHRRGGRVAGIASDDIVVNLQGDEPMMPGSVIAAIAAALESAPRRYRDRRCPSSRCRNLDPNCVKALRRSMAGRWPPRARAPGTTARGISRHHSRAPGATSASTPTGCAACCNSRRGRRRHSSPLKSEQLRGRARRAAAAVWWRGAPASVDTPDLARVRADWQKSKTGN